MTLIFLKTRDIVYLFNLLIMLATFLYMPIALAHNVVSGTYTDGMRSISFQDAWLRFQSAFLTI